MTDGVSRDPRMPQTEFESLFYCTARIFNSKTNGETEVGTGFLYSADMANGRLLVALVTNKHVIAEYQQLRIEMLRSIDGSLTMPEIGQRSHLEINHGDGRVWFGHPQPDVDLAILPFMPLLDSPDWVGGLPYFVHIPRIWALWNADMEREIGALDSVEFIGYPQGFSDEVNVLPIARQGVVATLPRTDFEGRPVFLIDATVLQGSSGSPVFLANHGFHTAAGQLTLGSRLRLIGVIAETFHQDSDDPDLPGGPKHLWDLGLVVKARCVDEIMQLIATPFGGLVPV